MSRKRAAGTRGSFRIIGGKWRGRRLEFVNDGSVRPSPDRVRETLFNWAAPVIRGARCLDLFAGSGALGLEALSRGASEVVFNDSQRSVVNNLERQLQTLGAQATVICGDAMQLLQANTRPFDLIFVDPPFRQDWLPRLMALLPAQLNDGAHLYLECESDLPEGAGIGLPPGLELLKIKTAGQVRYHWIRHSA